MNMPIIDLPHSLSEVATQRITSLVASLLLRRLLRESGFEEPE